MTTQLNRNKMTTQNLIENATKKGYKIDQTYPRLIGLGKKHVWHWFDIIGGDVIFNHSYSQNNGKTKKGLGWKMAVYERLGFFENQPA